MAGNITQVERFRRMVQVRDLIDTGLSDSKIAEKLGMEITSVKRMKSYIKELSTAELTSKEIAKKRAELYIEITDAAMEARKLFNRFKEWVKCVECNGTGVIEVQEKCKVCKGKGILPGKKECTVCKGTGLIIKNKACTNCKGLGGLINSGSAKKFFDAWMDAIDRRMRLYGLDSIKTGDIIFNQQINNGYVPPDRVDTATADKLSKLLKDRHELSKRVLYEKNREY